MCRGSTWTEGRQFQYDQDFDTPTLKSRVLCVMMRPSYLLVRTEITAALCESEGKVLLAAGCAAAKMGVMKIWISEDEKKSALYLEKGLREAGYEVDVAEQ